ncbi:hypothetical protein [Streptomyces luteireticuli]|uniref:DNA-directed DNA polymerase n=1 Tax=Streptomyces luteireticuli TaxID=173858 RepID=A0ABN0YV82_9ACTN
MTSTNTRRARPAGASVQDYLPVAVRAWTDRPRDERWSRPVAAPGHILVIDTETTTDDRQALTFGAWRYCARTERGWSTVGEGLFYADDLPQRDPDGYAALRQYALTHEADVDLFCLEREPDWRLSLMSRSEFIEEWFWRCGYLGHGGPEPAEIVMFNAPFDLSRLACGAAEARGKNFGGGFSLLMWERQPDTGKDAPFRPRVAMKSIDGKRALKGFTRFESGKEFRGHFLDLRTLVFSLTGESHSLDSACRAFGVEQGKVKAPHEHGRITPEYIDYCRRDVEATTELHHKVTEEFDRHPVVMQSTHAYSPASIAKAYLSAMGMTPILDRLPDFPAPVLGHAMAAFYGGRAECRIRHTPAPVTLVDFTSMYPTVDALMNLWDFLTRENITTEDDTSGVQEWLDSLTLDECFRPGMWPRLVGLAQIVPDGDVVPVRSRYGTEPAWNIAVTPLHGKEPMWFTLADLAASTLLTGKAPRILRAVRFTAHGEHPKGLRRVKLRGEVTVDPRRGDFFRTVVEQRQQIKQQTTGHDAACGCEGCRLAAFLKMLANSGSYGIYVEMHRQQMRGGKTTPVTVHGAHDAPWTTTVGAPERPGQWCFPPLAACITGAGRLLLAMLERCVTDAGGAWMLCDTDSMAIVADPTGSLVACPGGPHRTADGQEAVRALTPAQVDAIRRRFDGLSPYTPGAVPTLLKTEFTGWCVAISTKRYACYRHDGHGQDVKVVKHSEHGLGHLLNPTNPDSDDRDWIRQLWELIIADAHGHEVPEPSWLNRPAVTRITVSSADLLRPFAAHNAGRPYAQQMKPGNFLLVAHPAPFGEPDGAAPAAFRLLAPYDRDPAQWERLVWRNLHTPDGPTYRITGDGFDPNLRPADTARVQTFRTVLTAYRQHPEHKAADPTGHPCTAGTRGLLARRTVRAHSLHHIGKESNSLEHVRAGLVAHLDEVQADYTPTTHTWASLVLPVLTTRTAGDTAGHLTAHGTAVTERQVNNVLTARSYPRTALRQALIRHAVAIAAQDTGTDPNDPWQAVLGHWHDHHQPTPPPTIPCACACGATFTNPRQKYATPTCRKRHQRRQTRARTRPPTGRPATADQATPHPATPPGTAQADPTK